MVPGVILPLPLKGADLLGGLGAGLLIGPPELVDDEEQQDNPAGDDGLRADPQHAGGCAPHPACLDDDRHPVPHAGHDKG